MEEDPFESIARECKITFSQEKKLKKCCFALESEEEDSSPPCSVQVTGIAMVSPPESNEDCLEDDAFHTPPEQHPLQSLSGSEDQGPEIRPGQTQVVLGNGSGGVTQAENAVDLGKDSVALGFSEPNVVKVNGIDCVNDVVCEADLLSKSNTERTVDLGKDSDTLVFSELNVVKRIDSVKDVVGDPDLSKVECDLKECKVLESECGQSVLNECNVSADNMEFTEPVVIESENVEIEETEVVNLAFKESCKEMGVMVSESTKNVDQRVEGANSGGRSAGKNIEDFDAIECASGGGVDVVMRELPSSFKEPEENGGLSVPQQSLNDFKALMDLVVAAGIFNYVSTTDTYYLKAAKEGGLAFYWPRWWPPEGFDDQIMDNI